MDNRLAEMSLSDLCDILLVKTQQLLDVMNRRADAATIKNCMNEVELIQKTIKDKQENGPS
jgi:hypothetical protein